MNSESHDKLTKERRSEQARSVFKDMLRGAILAAVVFFGPVLIIYLIYLVGTLLPPESKEADDPTPDSFSMVIEQRAV